jgi:hypothetical protein
LTAVNVSPSADRLVRLRISVSIGVRRFCHLRVDGARHQRRRHLPGA